MIDIGNSHQSFIRVLTSLLVSFRENVFSKNDYLRDAIKSTGMSKSVPKWVKTFQNTLKSI